MASSGSGSAAAVLPRCGSSADVQLDSAPAFQTNCSRIGSLSQQNSAGGRGTRVALSTAKDRRFPAALSPHTSSAAGNRRNLTVDTENAPNAVDSPRITLADRLPGGNGPHAWWLRHLREVDAPAGRPDPRIPNPESRWHAVGPRLIAPARCSWILAAKRAIVRAPCYPDAPGERMCRCFTGEWPSCLRC